MLQTQSQERVVPRITVLRDNQRNKLEPLATSDLTPTGGAETNYLPSCSASYAATKPCTCHRETADTRPLTRATGEHKLDILLGDAARMAIAASSGDIEAMERLLALSDTSDRNAPEDGYTSGKKTTTRTFSSATDDSRLQQST